MKKRVLFLGHSALRGGAEFCLDTTLRNLNRERIEPFAIFPTDGPMAESARQMDIPVTILPLCWWMLYEPSFWEWKNRLRIPMRLRFLKRFLKENEIQAVYSNTVCLFEGVLAARALGIPHFTHIHEVLEDQFMLPRWFSLQKIVRFYYQNSQRVIFESEPSRKIAEAHGNFGAEVKSGASGNFDVKVNSEAHAKQARKMSAHDFLKKSAVVSNSSRLTLAEVRKFQQEPPWEAWNSLREFGVVPEKWTLLWMGRFSDRKNPLMLIRAASKLPEQVRGEMQILLAGAGPLEEKIRGEIAERQLEETCRIVPFQEDVRPLLALGNALALTSHEESFGLVLVEAGMFSLPVLAVRSQGPSEIILDGETGFLVEPDDSEALAEKILGLFQDSPFCRTLGERNRERVLDLYDPVKNTRKIEDLICGQM